jgi:isoquinoline 1-oxidoreductase alpha subunit
MVSDVIEKKTVGGVTHKAKKITTIEGVFDGELKNIAVAVRDAWRQLNVVQCGYCQSGQIMSAIILLRKIPNPTDNDIDLSMEGNICRCGTYLRIRAAIHEAARTLGGAR